MKKAMKQSRNNNQQLEAVNTSKYLNESQVTAVKIACEKKSAVKTRLEKQRIAESAGLIMSDRDDTAAAYRRR
jgi:hypothetical protein